MLFYIFLFHPLDTLKSIKEGYPHSNAIYIMHAKLQKKNDICNYGAFFCVKMFIFYAFGTFFVVFRA